MVKLISSNEKEAREKIIAGINKAVDLVRKTLGPAGWNVAIQWSGGWSKITNDGVTILKQIELEDEVENIGANYIANAAVRTSEIAGDGTTTTAVIAQKIINDCDKRLNKNHDNPIELRKQIHEESAKVLKKIDEHANKVKTKKDLEAVAYAAGEDKELAKEIAEMVWKIGADGFVSVDDSGYTETTFKIINGMRVENKLLVQYVVTDWNKLQGIVEKEGGKYVPILVTNYDFNDGNEIYERIGSEEGIMKKIAEHGHKSMVIVAPKFELNALKLFNDIYKKYRFKIVPIKAPALTSNQLEDIAIYTGGKFIDNKTEAEVSMAEMKDIGFAEKVIVEPDNAAIIGGTGNNSTIQKRIGNIKAAIKREELERMKKKDERRIASLSSGIGVIKVGAETDVERGDKWLKIKNAVNSSKAAMDDGVVRGGGLLLKQVAEELDNSVITEALKAPYKQIQDNAGGKLTIPENVLDAAKVTKTAVKKACSIAGQVITCGGYIAVKRKLLMDELQDSIVHDDRHDKNRPPKDL